MANRAPIFTSLALATLLAAALVAAGGVTANLYAAEDAKAEPARLTISAQGEVRAAPDMAVISVGVTTQATNAKDAAQANSKAMNEAVASLKAAGIESRDLQTSNFSIQPLYTSDPTRNSTPRIANYRATNTLTVQIRDLAKVGDILERVVSLGANTISGPSFLVSEPEAKRDEARKAAIANALARAKLYADGLGFKLGRVLSVSESANDTIVRPAFARAAAAPLPAAPPPIEAGESAISSFLTVEWEILPRE